MQPTSLNVATALEAAQLHADLTQDLTNVYTNPLPNAYPLSAYSYLVAPCSPALAASQHTACAANPTGVPGVAPDRPHVAVPATEGTGARAVRRLPGLRRPGEDGLNLGYSPLPPVLVQEDFDAIGRMNGGQQPPPVSAADCKNPYVDGEIPLPGSPVVAGVGGGGSSAGPASTSGGGGAAAAAASAAGSAASGHSATGSTAARLHVHRPVRELQRAALRVEPRLPPRG